MPRFVHRLDGEMQDRTEPTPRFSHYRFCWLEETQNVESSCPACWPGADRQVFELVDDRRAEDRNPRLSQAYPLLNEARDMNQTTQVTDEPVIGDHGRAQQ